MGLPKYPDAPIPSWKEFRAEYRVSLFNASGSRTGRNFIILAGGTEVGTVGYDLFDGRKRRVVLDIWLRAERFCGHGYGPDALEALCDFLRREYGIEHFYISPSARNGRAIAAYRKAGFKRIRMSRAAAMKEFGVDIFDYADNTVMKRTWAKRS